MNRHSQVVELNGRIALASASTSGRKGPSQMARRSGTFAAATGQGRPWIIISRLRGRGAAVGIVSGSFRGVEVGAWWVRGIGDGRGVLDLGLLVQGPALA